MSRGTVVGRDARRALSHVKSNRATAVVAAAAPSTITASGGTVVVASGIASVRVIRQEAGVLWMRTSLDARGRSAATSR